MNIKNRLKSIGPGLLFASSAIGTSHLVLSTRAGAHHGMIFFWIIIAALILKYPFYEFGPRYASATGYSLVKGYKDQGKWAVFLFMVVVFINMFAVTAAVAAVSAGLLSTFLGVNTSMPILVGGILFVTAALLLYGGYKGLDNFIKIISVVLLMTVSAAFVAVLLKGPVARVDSFEPSSILNGAGLALLISLLGWMPSGMEASTMYSIWSVEKQRTTGYQPTLKESLFDFHLGYIFTILLALMFLVIGAYSVYGSGVKLEGNSTQFANQLLEVFTTNLGGWVFPVMAIAAFATIYGTLITAWDAFTRSFVRGLRVFLYEKIENNPTQQQFLKSSYNVLLPLVGVGAFFLFYFSAQSMIKILELATILGFLTAPIIAFINLRSVQSEMIPKEFRPSPGLIYLAYTGLAAMVAFSVYYLTDLIV